MATEVLTGMFAKKKRCRFVSPTAYSILILFYLLCATKRILNDAFLFFFLVLLCFLLNDTIGKLGSPRALKP